MAELNEHEIKIQAWLDTPPAERSLEVGAILMLQSNRNRTLHQNVLKRANFAKIEYELIKYMGDKYKKCDAPTVEKLEEELTIVSTTQKEESTGKREDHDALPHDIQAIYSRNSEVYARMRSLHERLKVLSGNGFTPCDRFPHLKELLALDTELRLNWDKYDNYVIGSEIQKVGKKPTPGVSLDVQRIGANRTYLNRASKEIPEKILSGKTEAASKQLAEAQIRYNELIMDGQQIDEATAEKLKAVGVIIAVVETTKPAEPDTTNTENVEGSGDSSEQNDTEGESKDESVENTTDTAENTDVEQKTTDDVTNPPAGE